MAEIETTSAIDIVRGKFKKADKGYFYIRTASSSTVIAKKPTNKISPPSRNTTLKSLPMPMRTWRNTTEHRKVKPN